MIVTSMECRGAAHHVYDTVYLNDILIEIVNIMSLYTCLYTHGLVMMSFIRNGCLMLMTFTCILPSEEGQTGVFREEGQIAGWYWYVCLYDHCHDYDNDHDHDRDNDFDHKKNISRHYM